MEYRNLGQSGLKVSVVGFGSWLTVGNRIEQAASDALVRTAFEAGVNFFDTADIYNTGEGEQAFGRALRELPRHRLVIASKCFFPMSDDVNDRGLSRKHIVESLDKSLVRLGCEYLDLYQCHRPDPDTPLRETCMAMDDAIRAGKVLYWGVSAWPGHLIARAVELCARYGWHAPISNQPRYNLLDRHIESEVLPASAAAGVGQVVYSPLAQGVLTGKYRPHQPPPGGTRATDDAVNQFIGQFMGDDQLERVAKFVELSLAWGSTPAQISLAWCMLRPEVSSVIVGATKTEQLLENLGAVAFEWEPGMRHQLEQLFPANADDLQP